MTVWQEDGTQELVRELIGRLDRTVEQGARHLVLQQQCFARKSSQGPFVTRVFERSEAIIRNTLRIYAMRYEWDEAKNLQNQQKHEGISFEMAALVFEDERCLLDLDRIDKTGEQRWHAIGTARIESRIAVVLLVVHAYREDIYGEEIIRIISARRAKKHEVRRYQGQTVD